MSPDSVDPGCQTERFQPEKENFGGAGAAELNRRGFGSRAKRKTWIYDKAERSDGVKAKET